MTISGLSCFLEPHVQLKQKYKLLFFLLQLHHCRRRHRRYEGVCLTDVFHNRAKHIFIYDVQQANTPLKE